jgi:preprotein translocase subunit YajC
MATLSIIAKLAPKVSPPATIVAVVVAVAVFGLFMYAVNRAQRK